SDFLFGLAEHCILVRFELLWVLAVGKIKSPIEECTSVKFCWSFVGDRQSSHFNRRLQQKGDGSSLESILGNSRAVGRVENSTDLGQHRREIVNCHKMFRRRLTRRKSI